MNKIIIAMGILRTSLKDEGATDNEVNVKIKALNAELGSLYSIFAAGSKQRLIDSINATSLLSDAQKTEFISNLT